jgi:hypothetical protein
LLYVCASAIINRCGFNSEGIVAVAKRLGAQHGKRKLDETSSASSTSNTKVIHGGKAGPGILGVNLGKNKTSEDAAADYVRGVHTLSQYSDYLVELSFHICLSFCSSIFQFMKACGFSYKCYWHNLLGWSIGTPSSIYMRFT